MWLDTESSVDPKQGQHIPVLISQVRCRVVLNILVTSGHIELSVNYTNLLAGISAHSFFVF